MDVFKDIICVLAVIEFALEIVLVWMEKRKNKAGSSRCTCRSERVMFTPDAKRPCKTFIDSLKRNQRRAPEPCKLKCKFYHGWTQEKQCAQAEVLRTLSTAKKSVYMCSSTLTNLYVNDLLEYLSRVKKVQVLILIDCESPANHQNDSIVGLKNAGIPIRWNSRVAKHIKYCIVDREIMILGSLDWSNQVFHDDDDDDDDEEGMVMWTESQENIKQIYVKFVNCFNTGET